MDKDVSIGFLKQDIDFRLLEYKTALGNVKDSVDVNIALLSKNVKKMSDEMQHVIIDQISPSIQKIMLEISNSKGVLS